MSKRGKLTFRVVGMSVLMVPLFILIGRSFDYMFIWSLGREVSVLGLVGGRFEEGEGAYTMSMVFLGAAFLVLWVMHDLYKMKGMFGWLFKDIRAEVLEKSGMEDD